MSDLIERLRTGCDGRTAELDCEAADEIERLEALARAASWFLDAACGDAESLRNTITSIHLSLKERDAEIERLTARNKNQKAVVDAARDFVNNHMDHDDAMRIFDALAALEEDDANTD